LIKRRRAASVAALLAVGLLVSTSLRAEITLSLLGFQGQPVTLGQAAGEVSQRTSLVLSKDPILFAKADESALGTPLIWSGSTEGVVDANDVLRDDLSVWLKRGGMLVIQGHLRPDALKAMTSVAFRGESSQGTWMAIPPDHVLMRSFYLLDSLPSCGSEVWNGFQFDGRVAILVVPIDFIQEIADGNKQIGCPQSYSRELVTRAFVNVLMLALATDYKQDQIHLPEILKRLR
jgi:hypothetical protein